MRNHLWDTITTVRYTEYYCREYRRHYRSINNRIICACIMITTVSLVLMTIITQQVVLFAILGIAGQAVQVIIPMLTYSKRIESANFYILCARRIADDAEQKWYKWDISDKEDNEQAALIIVEVNQAMTSLDNDCFHHDDLPKKRSIEAKVYKEWKKYLESF